MATLAILTKQPQASIAERIRAAFPDAHYVWSPDITFVRTSKTPAEVSRDLNVMDRHADGSTSGDVSQLIVVELAPIYFGFSETTLWGWLKTSFEAGR